MNAELIRINGLERQRELLIKTINKLRESYAVEDDPVRSVRFEEQLIEQEGKLRRLEEELRQLFGINTLTGRTVLGNKIEQLGIRHKLGVLDLVNCNRDEQVNHFWDLFDDLADSRFQFYFLTSCNTQKPSSFAERMIYEFIIEELQEAKDALFYRRDQQEALGRPLMEQLPKGRNLTNCQNAFKKYFADFWNLGEQQSLEEYLRNGLPRSEYDAIALFFKLDADRWKMDVTLPYLEWMIQTLQQAHADVPRVLVFLKVNFAGAHLQTETLAKNSAFTGIQHLVTQHPGVAHLLPFLPVNRQDVLRWFDDLGTRQTALLDELLQTFSRGLDPQDQRLYQDQQQFNMDDVEMLQWEVFKIVNKTKTQS